MAHEADYPYIFRTNMGIYLEALNNTIRRRHGDVKVHIIVAGGSSLILAHTFRTSTEDIDTYIKSKVGIKRCIQEVRDMYSITSDWMNDDFTKSKSFSPRISDHAVFVKDFGCLTVSRVCDLDLICMKLVSFREKDYNDLVGLIHDFNRPITQSEIANELEFLYGKDWFDLLKVDARNFANLMFVRG